MQQETVITLGLYILGAALLAYSIFRAITTAYRRGYAAGTNNAEASNAPIMLAQTQANALASQQIDAAQEKLAAANAVIDHLKADKAQLVAVTPQEIGLLVQAANMIELAHRTWAPIKGVEPTARKAQTVLQKLEALNSRLKATATQVAQGKAA